MKEKGANSALYMKVYYYIVDAIMNGSYEIGDALPTQMELAEQFNVSRVTIREAIKQLVARHIVETVKGRGTFVIKKPVAISGTERTAGFSRSNKSSMGRTVHSKLIRLETVAADRMLSACLRIPVHAMLIHLKRVRIIDDTPLCLDDSYIVKRYTKDVDFFQEDLENGSLYKLLQDKADIELESVDERFRAVSCPENVAEYLELNPGEPVLESVRFSYDKYGRVIEYCVNHERTDMYYTSVRSRRWSEESVDPIYYQKILGCLLGAAGGDVAGAKTRNLCPATIQERFGGFVDWLDLARGTTKKDAWEAGFVTGAFSQAYFMAIELSKANGKVTQHTVENALLAWADYPEFFRMAGPTSEAGIRRLLGENVTDKLSYLACQNEMATNGVGARTISAGMISRGDVNAAIQYAITMCLPTHPYDASTAAGCAVAAAVCAAMEKNATLDDVLDAGIMGARDGFLFGKKVAKPLAVASVEKRIHLAVGIGKSGRGWEDTLQELADIVGTGLAANEAIPCAFGILAANPDSATQAIKMAVNIGGDTNMIATIVGAIAGALYGVDALPSGISGMIRNTNGFDLEWLAHDIARFYYGE